MQYRMQLNEIQLKQIEEYAELLMAPSEIEVLVYHCFGELERAIRSKGTPANIAYQRGKLKTKAALRSMVITLAKKGSPQAELLADKYIKDSEFNDA